MIDALTLQRLGCAARIPHAVPCERSSHRIGDPRCQPSREGVAPLGAVAVHEIVLGHVLQQPLDIPGITLTVSIHEDADVPGGPDQASVDGCALTQLARQTVNSDADLLCEDLERSIRAAIVDSDDLCIGLGASKGTR